MKETTAKRAKSKWLDSVFRGLALLAAPYLWTPEVVDFGRE